MGGCHITLVVRFEFGDRSCCGRLIDQLVFEFFPLLVRQIVEVLDLVIRHFRPGDQRGSGFLVVPPPGVS